MAEYLASLIKRDPRDVERIVDLPEAGSTTGSSSGSTKSDKKEEDDKSADTLSDRGGEVKENPGSGSANKKEVDLVSPLGLSLPSSSSHKQGASVRTIEAADLKLAPTLLSPLWRSTVGVRTPPVSYPIPSSPYPPLHPARQPKLTSQVPLRPQPTPPRPNPPPHLPPPHLHP